MGLPDLQQPATLMILLLAAFIYYRLLQEILLLHLSEAPRQSWQPTLKRLVPALPLLGLLGTISGLMDTFNLLATGSVADIATLLSSGIGAALLSTQAGLVAALPGWLLLCLLGHCRRRNAHEPA